MKKHTLYLLTVFLLSTSIGFCDKNTEQVDELIKWMTGTFTSTEQAAKDSTYIDISITVTPIWTELKNGNWLYIETSFSSNPGKPYKQQIFQLTPNSIGLIKYDTYLIAQNYLIKNNSQSPAFFQDLQPDSLTLKAGCSIYFNKIEDYFSGLTSGERCTSNLRGAKYAVTDFEVSIDDIYIWERGYDFKNNLVWGNKNGGFIFKKEKKEKK